ncbi:MAG TPA: response regulator, partial [Aliiroseovarius sp.]|nr:response regulator [Aliiroseovarius sp.]
MNILVVDDDPLIVDLLNSSLVAMGFNAPVSAGSAEEAMQIIESAETPFSTFLLDIFLPETDGVELCTRIRQLPQHSATPIIMITASRRTDLMERAFRAGATDYVTKPLDGLELGTRVKVAGMLNESLEREKRYRHTLEDLTELTRVKYDEIISLRNVPGIVDHVTMQNSLLRAERGC